MKAENLSVLEFIGSSKRTFYIPVYQRNYDWGRKQCNTLFKDIEDIAGDMGRKSHFLGTVVYLKGESDATFSTFTIIDGQQRLTTLMILLKAIADSIDDVDIRDDIIESYLINKRGPESLRIKLKPMKSDSDNYQKLISGKINEMQETNILNNYQLFMKLISESTLEPRKLYEGMQRLEIVYIQLEQNKEDPQLIFESLNSTGVELTKADLIRNFLLMGQEHKRQEELYNRYWTKIENMLPDKMISDFVRDYLTLKTGSIPDEKSVYDCFKKYYRALNNYDSEGFLEELTMYGEYYSWFKLCNSPSVEINTRLGVLQKLKSTTVYPLLLSIFEDCYIYKSIDDQMVCKAIDIVISYIIRRLLCEMPTNALNKVFATMAKDIENIQSGDLEEKLVRVLAAKKGKAVFPNDSMLREKLLNRDCYKFSYMKFVLENIENIQGKEKVDFENLTLEHIMPQTLSAKWNIDLGKKAEEIHTKYVNNIGNLTLTGYNSELSNYSYDKKKEYYSRSNIYITRELADNNHWGETEIIKRANRLIDDICKIWTCPMIINNRKLEKESQTEFDIMDDVDVTGRAPYEIEILGEKFSVSSWKAFFEVLCTNLYQYDSQIFRSLAEHNDFKGRSKRIIDVTDNNIRKPIKLADELYIESNLSANDILNYSKLIVEKFDGMENECSYKIKA